EIPLEEQVAVDLKEEAVLGDAGAHAGGDEAAGVEMGEQRQRLDGGGGGAVLELGGGDHALRETPRAQETAADLGVLVAEDVLLGLFPGAVALLLVGADEREEDAAGVGHGQLAQL